MMASRARGATSTFHSSSCTGSPISSAMPTFTWCVSPPSSRTSTTSESSATMWPPFSSAFSSCSSPAAAGFGPKSFCFMPGPNVAPAAELTLAMTSAPTRSSHDFPPFFFGRPGTSSAAGGTSSLSTTNHLSTKGEERDAVLGERSLEFNRLRETSRAELVGQLPLDVDELLQHLVSRRDRLRVGRKRALVRDEVDELLREVDVRLLESADRDRAAAAGAGDAESGDAAVTRFDPQALACATETFVRPELRDGELADGDLLAVGVHAAHGAVAVDGDAGEVAGRVAVLRLARDVRGTTEL